MIGKEELEEMIKENLAEESFVLVVFHDVGSVQKSVALNNVIPEQILALGAELEMIGKNGILQTQQMQAQQQKEQGIVVPKSMIETP